MCRVLAIPEADGDRLPHPVYPEARVELQAALMDRRHFDYLYEFGNQRKHKLRIERALPAAPLADPVCVDGGGESAYSSEGLGMRTVRLDVTICHASSNTPTIPVAKPHSMGVAARSTPFAFEFDLGCRGPNHIKLYLSRRSAAKTSLLGPVGGVASRNRLGSMQQT